MRSVRTTAVLAMLAFACGSEGSPGGKVRPRELVARLDTRLRECGVLSAQGRWRAYQPDEFEAEDYCYRACMIAAEDCADVKASFCGGINAASPRYDQCLVECGGESRCGDGTIIPSFLRCDHWPDCSDGSDEEDCEWEPVEPNCADGSDYEAGSTFPWRCNGAVDCADGSDEQGCGTIFFMCADGSKVLAFKECDLRRNCPDASDEHEDCAMHSCGENW